MSDNYKDGKILANFRVDPKDWVNFGNMSRQMFGHGAISRLLQSYVKDWLQKNDGKTPRMDKFLDPNFIPKPIVFDDIDKIVMPFSQNLSDAELHNLRVWSFQVYNICQAYSKMSPLKRKNVRMSYDQLFDIANRD